MTALLTDAEIAEAATKHSTFFGGSHRSNADKRAEMELEFLAGARFARSIYEARLAEDAKVRAGLVEALNDSNNTLGFLAWQVFGAPGFTDRHDDQGVCLRRMKTNDAALAAAKEIK